MARKPRSEWTEAYRKRIERGERRGLTRQQARGKKSGEHIIRKQREAAKEAAKERLSTSHNRAFSNYIANLPSPYNRSEKYRSLATNLILEKGWDWFLNVRKTRNDMIRNSRKAKMPGSGVYDAILLELGIHFGIDDFLLYYHG